MGRWRTLLFIIVVGAGLAFSYMNCQSQSLNKYVSGIKPSTGVTASSVLQFHKNASHDGHYIEPSFTMAAAAGLHIDTSFSAPVDGPVYAQPLFVEGRGSPDLLIVVTEQNHVVAFDASDGRVVWDKLLGSPVPLSQLPCGNIDPLGITGTPVIDGVTRTIYLDAMTTPDGGATQKHLIFALSVDDGTVKSGWPVDVSAKVKSGSVTFNSSVQGERGALNLLNGYLYVPYGGFWGDCGTYHGWVVAVPVDNPGALLAWATSARGGGIWSSNGLVSDGASIFGVTGNTFGVSTWSGGEAVLRFSPPLSFSGSKTDYFVPTNWQNLDTNDIDLGGAGFIVFSVPGASPSQLGMSLGKDGNAYLLDLKNLGGVSNALSTLRVSDSEINAGSTAYTTGSGSYVAFSANGNGQNCPAGQGGDLVALKISATSPPSLSVAWCNSQNGDGAPIMTTTDGTGNPIVWGLGAENSNRLYGFDANTGQVIFNGGGSNEHMSTVQHFQTPIVAKGRIYVAANDRIYAFTVDSR